MRFVFSALVLLGLMAGSPTAASEPVTTTVTLTGTMTEGRDTIGVFTPWGSNLAGYAFSATYTIVTFANSSIAAGQDLIATGGAGLPAPTVLSFSITINGKTLSNQATTSPIVKATSTTGSIGTNDGLSGLSSQHLDSFSASGTNAFTTSAGKVKTFTLSTGIESVAHNFVSDTKSLNAIPSLDYSVGADDVVRGDFHFTLNSTATPVLSWGAMSIQHISIASTPEAFPPVDAVPEPGEWAMMLAGLAVVGAVARRRRR